MYMHGGSVAAKPLGPATPGTDSFSQTLSNIANSVLQVVGTGLQLKSQQDLARINIARLQAGQAPIQYDQVPGIVPTAQVQASLDSGTRNTVLWVAGGAAALILIMSMQKKRR